MCITWKHTTALNSPRNTQALTPAHGRWHKLRFNKMEATGRLVACGCTGAVKRAHNKAPPWLCWFPVRWVRWRCWSGDRRRAIWKSPGGTPLVSEKILNPGPDYPWMKVSLINNSGGLCIISHCSKEEGAVETPAVRRPCDGAGWTGSCLAWALWNETKRRTRWIYRVSSLLPTRKTKREFTLHWSM